MLIESGSEGQGVLHRFILTIIRQLTIWTPACKKRDLGRYHLSGLILAPAAHPCPSVILALSVHPCVCAYPHGAFFPLRGSPTSSFGELGFSFGLSFPLVRQAVWSPSCKKRVTSSHPDMQFQMGKNLGRKCFTHTWCKRLLVPTS